MEFSAAATFFDTDEVFDAYTGNLLFMAHATPHDDHTSSGATSRRRTLIAAVDTAAPPRRAVRWYDTFWVVGNDNTDGFQGEETRRSFGLKKSTGLVEAVTPGGACLAAAGVAFHAHKEYFRDMTDAVTSSDYDVMWNIFCPLDEPVVKGSFLVQDGQLLRVRNTYQSVDEYLIAETDQLDADARQSAVFTSKPGLDFGSAATAVTTTVPAIQTDSQKFYQFRSEAEAGNKAGDRAVFVAKSSITPKVGDTFTMQGATWRAVTVVSELDAWVIRARQ